MADPRSSEPVVNGAEGSVEGALSALTALGPEAGALVESTLRCSDGRWPRPPPAWLVIPQPPRRPACAVPWI